MKAVTYKEFLRLKPCWLKDGRAGQLAEIGARKERWTALDVLKLGEVEAEDRLWAVLRTDFIDASVLHEFACRCAERALREAGIEDERSWAALETKRRWIKGEATNDELDAASDAAWDAACSAAEAAAWFAAGAAAEAAAWFAAMAAARSAARRAEWSWQVDVLISMLED